MDWLTDELVYCWGFPTIDSLICLCCIISKHEKALWRKQKQIIEEMCVWSWGVKLCMKHTRKRPLHDYCFATQFTWIFTVLLQVAKKSFKGPHHPSCQIIWRRAWERSHEKNVATAHTLTTFRFLQKVSRIIWGPFLKVSKGRSNDWSFLRSSFMIMNAELLTLKLEVLMAIFSRFIKL